MTNNDHLPILVTGAAGFIGFHLARRLLDEGRSVIGLDNLNDYYDPSLKQARLASAACLPALRVPSSSTWPTGWAWRSCSPPTGSARWSTSPPRPGSATRSRTRTPTSTRNLVGFLHILEGCRHQQVEHLVYASSSSVYGANTKMPFSVHHNVDHPVSPLRRHQEGQRADGPHLRAPLRPAEPPACASSPSTARGAGPTWRCSSSPGQILAGEPIDVYNDGHHRRDFTYIDDIVEGVVRVMAAIPEPNPDWSGDAPDPATARAPYRVYNIGNNQPVELMRYIEVLEECLGTKAEKNMLPMQPGDVPDTYADVDGAGRRRRLRPRHPDRDRHPAVRRLVSRLLSR